MSPLNKKLTTKLALALAITLGLAMVTILANIPPADFELGPGGPELDPFDAGGVAGLTNIRGGPLQGPDWDDLFDADGNTVASFGGTPKFLKDDVSAGGANDRSVYSGGPGDKNQDHVSDWTWSTSSVPAKDDITNAFAFAKIVGTDLIIYVGVEREDPSGSSHVDIEFFQNQIGLSEPEPCDAGQCTFTFTGSGNKDGDMLASLDYSQGGAFAGLEIRKRHEGVKNNYDEVADLGTQGCNAAETNLPAGTVCSFTNGGPIFGGSWPNFDNHGAEITVLPTNAFTEFAVNVTDLFNGVTPCFSTIQIKTRSSPSFTATLKDFKLGDFQSCNATATTQIHNAAHGDITGTTVANQTQIHDYALVTGTPGFAAPTGTVKFTRFSTDNCTAGTEVGSPQTVSLTTIAGTSNASAESSTITATPGGLSYLAEYSGDGNYGADAAPCEPLNVTKFNSALNTDIKFNANDTVSLLNTAINNTTAKTVFDFVKITGNSGTAGSPDPTGSVTIVRYGAGACTGTPVGSPETITFGADAAPNNLDGLKTVQSQGYVLGPSTGAGTFLSFLVTYSGDSNYSPSASLVCEALCAFPFDKAITP